MQAVSSLFIYLHFYYPSTLTVHVATMEKHEEKVKSVSNWDKMES